jgi:hypothetical protein
LVGEYFNNFNFLGIHMFISRTISFVALLLASVFACVMSASSFAQSSTTNKAPSQLASQDTAKDQIYGWQVMSDAERDAYKKQIASFKNSTERDVFLQDHRTRMNSRARERGITLRDTPASSSQSSAIPSPSMGTHADTTKPAHNTTTQIRPGTGAGPYKDK